MIDINMEADAFVEKIKNTDIYIRFIDAKNVVDHDKNLRLQLDEFRKRSFEIQVGHNYGYYNSYEQLLHLNNQNEELLLRPEIQTYLSCELELSKTISAVIELITNQIDINLDFLDI